MTQKFSKGALVKLKHRDSVMRCIGSPDEDGGVDCQWHSGNLSAYGYFPIEDLIVLDAVRNLNGCFFSRV